MGPGDDEGYDDYYASDQTGGDLEAWDPGGDTAPAGAGGDPYSDAPPDMDTADTMAMGMAPGGTDAQLTPFSPGGGFDFTNVLQGVARGFGGGFASQLAGTSMQAGPFKYNSGPGINALPYGGPGARAPQPGGANIGVMTPGKQVGLIVRTIRDMTGMRVSAKSIVGLIVRYGFPAAAAMFKVDVGTLLPVFMQAKAVRHHRRGPGLYTIAKKLRRADRLRRTVSHILGPAIRARHAGRRAPPRRRR